MHKIKYSEYYISNSEDLIQKDFW